MTLYRLIWLDQTKNVVKSEEIECATDRVAINVAAHEIGGCLAVEIWHGKRPVCLYGNPSLIALTVNKLPAD